MTNRANWIFESRTPHGDIYSCSNCGHKYEETDEGLPNRCIMCGMDMVIFKFDTPTEKADTPTEANRPTDTPTDHIRPLSPEQQKVCADVIKFYGYDLQRMVAIEEMSELTKELSKQKRGKGDREHIIEEIADVYICLEMLEQMNGITREELYEWIDKKVDRIDKRIKSEGKIEA